MNFQKGDNVYGTYFLFISDRNGQIADLSLFLKGIKVPPIKSLPKSKSFQKNGLLKSKHCNKIST